jgi:hypothetical protein
MLDGLQSRDAIVERSGQDDGDDAVSVVMRCGAKQRVNGRAMEILLGSAPDLQAAAVHAGLQPRRRHIDAAANRFAIDGVRGRQDAGPVEDLRQVAVCVRFDAPMTMRSR